MTWLKTLWVRIKVLAAAAGLSSLLVWGASTAAGVYLMGLDYFLTLAAWNVFRAMTVFGLLYPPLVVWYFILRKMRLNWMVSTGVYAAVIVAGFFAIAALAAFQASTYAWVITMAVLNMVFIIRFDARFNRAATSAGSE